MCSIYLGKPSKMIDPYAMEERIALRMDSGMTEREAIKLTDAEENSLAARVARLKQQQQMKPQPYRAHKDLDTAAMAAGDRE
jgi:hypothetical protein